MTVGSVVTVPWLDDVAWERKLVGGFHGFRWGRLGGDYVGEWAGVLVLRVDAAGRLVSRSPDPRASAGAVDKILHGEGAAFRRSVVGQLSLHASAVAFGSKALVLVGESGAGKSTLAFHLCEGCGGELLADDVAAIDGADAANAADPTDPRPVRVAPSERVLWLDQGGGAKSPIPARCASDLRDVAAFVVLEFDDRGDRAEEPAVRRRAGARALESLLGAILRFDPVPRTWEREFESVGRWTASAPVWELVRSRRVPARQAAECLTRRLQPILSDRP